MDQSAAIETALATLRPSLGADGYDLRLDGVNGEVVNVVLEAGPEACADCMVPDDMLTLILQDAIRDRDPSLTTVVLHKVGFDRGDDHV